MEKFPDLNKYSRIHFIGAGGVSMSSLAIILAQNGKTVTGSDSSESERTAELRAHNVRVFIGHAAENAKDAQLVVYTAAIKDSNPELVYAKQNDIPSIERAVLLGMLMATYNKSVAVAGTHGKSTTTSMISSVLLDASCDPTILIGAHLNRINANFRVGGSDYAVYEACEYVNSFLHFYPHTAVILNIDADHLDFFKDLDSIKSSFKRFTENVAPGGLIIVNGDDPNCAEIVADKSHEVLTFGLNPNNDCYAKNIGSSGSKPVFDAVCRGVEIPGISLSVAGNHNIMNALAAILYAKYYGVPDSAIISGLAAFTGADRRFQVVNKVNGADVVDDYAHHPTEIAATISAAKSMGYKKVCVIFQPHTYTRTKLLQNEFIKALSQADSLILTDIYSAREINTIGANVMDIVNAVPGAGYISSREEIAQLISSQAQPGEVYILMGAGDINKAAELL